MASSRVYHLVCKVCKEKFQHPTKRATCTDECRWRGVREQHAELVRYRQSLTKTCPECRCVFSWEDKKEVTEGAFLTTVVCCSAECFRIYQRKETTARNSILYHGVKLTIEDVCALEQKSLQTVQALMRKKALPGAKWADPKRRKVRARQRSKRVREPRDQRVTVRLTREHLEELQAASQRSGAGLSDWAAGRLLECARQEARKA